MALDLAGGASIHVLSIARIYGTALGLQHPGLLPSKRELAAQEDIVGAAMKRIQGSGGVATGEVIATRDNAKTISGAATRYSVRHIVLDPTEATWLRRLVEGDLVRSLRRRLGPGVTVHVAQPEAF